MSILLFALAVFSLPCLSVQKEGGQKGGKTPPPAGALGCIVRWVASLDRLHRVDE